MDKSQSTDAGVLLIIIREGEKNQINSIGLTKFSMINERHDI